MLFRFFFCDDTVVMISSILFYCNGKDDLDFISGLLSLFFTDALSDIREEAEKYGRVTELCTHGGHAYIEFEEASSCFRAQSGFTGRTFDGKPVIAAFYPAKLWSQKIFS